MEKTLESNGHTVFDYEETPNKYDEIIRILAGRLKDAADSDEFLK